MASLQRDSRAVAGRRFDLAVVGGGVQGAFLALEASRRGLRCILLERDDFGANTSYNSLRIIHGGLRYLQSADLPRFTDSVAERSWFLRALPELIEPLPCLMPLYGRGLRRPAIMRAALAVNDAISLGRNNGLRADRRIPGGSVLTPLDVGEIWPGVPREGLCGGARWYDACVPDSQRMIMEVLMWAAEEGASPLNYTEARPEGCGESESLAVRDLVSGSEFSVSCDVAVWATGPWRYPLAAGGMVHGDRHFSLAWNILLDREAPSDHALALTPPGKGAQTYFLHPWKGRMLAGTGHDRWDGNLDRVRPSEKQIARMIAQLNQAAPSLGVRLEDTVRIHAGLLPATRPGGTALSDRPSIIEHRVSRGPRVFSVSGVKLTTARSVADRVLKRAFPRAKPRRGFYEGARGVDRRALPCSAFHGTVDLQDQTVAAGIRALAEEEAVVHLDDLIFRRTNIGDDPRRANALGGPIFDVLEWDRSRRDEELARVEAVSGGALPD